MKQLEQCKDYIREIMQEHYLDLEHSEELIEQLFVAIHGYSGNLYRTAYRIFEELISLANDQIRYGHANKNI